MCLGLMVSLPLPSQLYPLADGRLIRELARVGTHRDQEVSADAFLAGLAVRLPYLDGGRMFLVATRRLGHSPAPRRLRSEEHTSELQSLMCISYTVLCMTKTIIYNSIIPI